MSVHSRIVAGIVAALMMLWALGGASARAEGRVALVVGNSAYRNVPMLPNPTNDAGDVAASLDRLGFAVTIVKDASFDDLRHALISFGSKARDADMAVIYFAGHGMEVAGENWLIPVDAELRSDADTENEAIGLKSLTLAVAGAKTIGLVILDACRNNPFDPKMQHADRARAVSRGLAPIEPADNVLVAFAAKDGTTANDGEGRNSPFTAALLRNIETPGLEISFLFRNVRDDVLAATDRKQQPFIYGSLSKEAVYLKASPADGAQAGRAKDAPAADEVAWPFIAETSDVTLLHRFVLQFPASSHRAEAEARATSLSAKSPTPGGPDNPVLPSTSSTFDIVAPKPAEQVVARLFQSDAPQVEAAWSVVKTSADPADLRRFADAFPNQARGTIIKALGSAPGSNGVLRQLRADQMRAVLSGYGTFLHHPRYGDVWSPTVTPKGWHPYEPCHWVNSRRLGWYYLDRTPWGAIVHHFGRWTHDDQLGWIWVPGTDFSPGWVVWRTSPQQIGWAPMPPVEDVRTISVERFEAADFWIFMDAATFATGCRAEAAAAPSQVPSLLQSTTYIRDVKVVGGIVVAVLPASLAGPVVDVAVSFDPWPAWLVSQLLVDWNWVWALHSLASAAVCPPQLAPAIAAPHHAPAAPAAAAKSKHAATPRPPAAARSSVSDRRDPRRRPPPREMVDDPGPPMEAAPGPVFAPPIHGPRRGFVGFPGRVGPPVLFPIPGRGAGQGYGRYPVSR